MVTKHNKEIIMSMRIVPILIAATFIAGFGMGDYLSKQKVLKEVAVAEAQASTEEAPEFSKYELEMLARSSRLLVIQEQVAMMILQDRGELPFKNMLATEEEIEAAKSKAAEAASGE